MNKISYRRHRFPAEIIQRAVWLCFRFPLSYRDVEDLLAERGVDVSYETIRRWALKFGQAYARKLRQSRPRPDDRWHLDEVFSSINGKRMYLWRAVDSEGEVLDILVQSRRNKKAALKLMRKLLKKQGYAPNKVVTDKLPSYGAALRDLNMTGKHVTRRTEQQSGGEFAPAGSTTRTQDAGLQVIRIGAKVSLHPRRHLQHLQCPTSSDHSQDNAPIPR